MIVPKTAPETHLAFVRLTIATLSKDARFVGIAAAGSWAEDRMDDFSDIDLLIAVDPAKYDEVIRDRRQIAGSLGPLLTSFTGEHVGEPRLLICLFGPAALHVDLKFVSIEDAGQRVDKQIILWERGDALSNAFAAVEPMYPSPDRQWIEDRFWVWVHYAATKIARGELFEAIEFVSFLRMTVLGPLALMRVGKEPRGVRRLELFDPSFASALRATVTSYGTEQCFNAVVRCVDLYLELRGDGITIQVTAEAAAVRYLHEQCGSATQPGRPKNG